MSSSSRNMILRCFTSRTFLCVAAASCLLFLLGSFLSSPSQPEPLQQPKDSSNTATSDPLELDQRCNGFPSPPDVLVIIKTGANEIYNKVPTQLLTMLQCYQDLLVFSDMEQRIGNLPVHDALDNIADSVKSGNSDFDYYRTLQDYKRNGRDINTLGSDAGAAAWTLDKYKFLHMLEKTWKMRPGLKWYIFIEADTYLVRSNLLLWTKRLDPSQPWFMGSPTYIGGRALAHGGSGFVLSGAALSKFAEGDSGVASRYDESMKHEEFGDYILTKALQDKGVELSKRWPMLQAEKPSSIPFGPGPDNGIRHWCQPIVTMHHIRPDEATKLWYFEQQRINAKVPLLLEELYQDFVGPDVRAERDDWYNLSDDLMYRPPGVEGDRQKNRKDMSALEEKAHMSFEDCGRACEEHSRCFQYAYSPNSCGFSFSYRLGNKRVPESGKSFKSGWKLAKIDDYQAANRCHTPEWL